MDPISVNWGTKVIFVPRNYLTLVSGTLYTLDTDQFRLDLRGLEASTEGQPHDTTHDHNTEVTIAGTTYARGVQIINGYSVEFEDGQYSVQLTGSNNNIWDIESGILVQNQVQVIPGNSAGLIVGEGGSGGTEIISTCGNPTVSIDRAYRTVTSVSSKRGVSIDPVRTVDSHQPNTSVVRSHTRTVSMD